jgi:hypothetical protein
MKLFKNLYEIVLTKNQLAVEFAPQSGREASLKVSIVCDTFFKNLSQAISVGTYVINLSWTARTS